jgi:hypothetical protein
MGTRLRARGAFAFALAVPVGVGCHSEGGAPAPAGTGGVIVEHCFAAGTPVATPGGPVPIESLAPGDVVLSYDEERHAVVRGRVVANPAAESRSVGIFLRDGGPPLVVTAEHPIYDAGQGRYRTASSLRPETRLLSLIEGEGAPRGTTSDIALGWGAIGRRLTVYNLSITPHPNYFAGGVLVHNKPPPCDTVGSPPCPRLPCSTFGGVSCEVDDCEWAAFPADFAVGLESCSLGASNESPGVLALDAHAQAGGAPPGGERGGGDGGDGPVPGRAGTVLAVASGQFPATSSRCWEESSQPGTPTVFTYAEPAVAYVLEVWTASEPCGQEALVARAEGDGVHAGTERELLLESGYDHWNAEPTFWTVRLESPSALSLSLRVDVD